MSSEMLAVGEYREHDTNCDPQLVLHILIIKIIL